MEKIETPIRDFVPLLDHGFVRLVDHMGSDLAISRAARISYDAPPREEDTKLINYLWEKRHTTPFEAVVFTFEVKAPIMVFRQWHRHRMWSYNELSARYKELPEEFYVPDPALIGVQSQSSKQARDITPAADPSIITARLEETAAARATMSVAFKCYHELLAAGWPRELARSVLPVATYSHMFGTVNLLNLIKFFSLRSHEHAQYEIRVYSDAMMELIRPIVPIAMAAFESSNQSNR